MGRKKKIENVIKELVSAGHDETQLVNMDEDVIRAIYEQFKEDVKEPVEEDTSEEIEESVSIDEVVEEAVDEEEVSGVIEEMENFEEEEQGESEEDEVPVISPSDVFKEEDIISMFDDSEKEGEYIKVNGLRRVAKLVIGPVVDQRVQLKSISIGDPDNGIYNGMAAIVTVYFKCGNLNFGEEGEIISFCDSADCIPSFNSDPEYGRYVSALATTRAEARVFRKALGISAVAAEEVTDLPPIAIAPKSSTNKLSGPQMIAIKRVCENRGIEDIDEFIKTLDIEKTLKELTQDEATDVLSALNKKRESKK